MYRKNSKYSKNNKFNKDCKLQKNFGHKFCRNFSKNMFNRNCLRKSQNSAKIAKVTRNFIATKRHPENYRKNCKNNKVTKEQT